MMFLWNIRVSSCDVVLESGVWLILTEINLVVSNTKKHFKKAVHFKRSNWKNTLTEMLKDCENAQQQLVQ